MSDEKTCPKCGGKQVACLAPELYSKSGWNCWDCNHTETINDRIAAITAERDALKAVVDEQGCDLANYCERFACDEPWRRFKKAIGELNLTPEMAAAKYRALKAVVDRLQHTADGVPMIPKGRYWAECRDRFCESGDDPFVIQEVVYWQGGGDDCFNPMYVLVREDFQWEFFDVEKVWSTRAAALASLETKEPT